MLLNAYCFVDKLFKLPVDIKKSTLLFKLRMPPELIEAANPGCPEQFRAGDIVSLGVCRWLKPWHFIYDFHKLTPSASASDSEQADCCAGGQYLASSGQTVYSVAHELNIKPYDIVKFNEDLNPIYPLQDGSVLTVPLPRGKCSSCYVHDLYNVIDGLFKLCWCR